jgi:hypothetical protein
VNLSTWIARLTQKLAALGILPGNVPGPEAADQHWQNVRDYYGFYLNPTLSAADIDAFERRVGIRVPDDYRLFLTEIGNGGYGPGEGLEPLGSCMGREWPAERFRMPFPLEEPLHTEEWLRIAETSTLTGGLLLTAAPLMHLFCGLAHLTECEQTYWNS